MVNMGNVWDRTTEFLSDNAAALLPIALLGLLAPHSINALLGAGRAGAQSGGGRQYRGWPRVLIGLWGQLARRRARARSRWRAADRAPSRRRRVAFGRALAAMLVVFVVFSRAGAADPRHACRQRRRSRPRCAAAWSRSICRPARRVSSRSTRSSCAVVVFVVGDPADADLSGDRRGGRRDRRVAPRRGADARHRVEIDRRVAVVRHRLSGRVGGGHLGVRGDHRPGRRAVEPVRFGRSGRRDPDAGSSPRRSR